MHLLIMIVISLHEAICSTSERL